MFTNTINFIVIFIRHRNYRNLFIIFDTLDTTKLHLPVAKTSLYKLIPFIIESSAKIERKAKFACTDSPIHHTIMHPLI